MKEKSTESVGRYFLKRIHSAPLKRRGVAEGLVRLAMFEGDVGRYSSMNQIGSLAARIAILGWQRQLKELSGGLQTDI